MSWKYVIGITVVVLSVAFVVTSIVAKLKKEKRVEDDNYSPQGGYGDRLVKVDTLMKPDGRCSEK